MSEDLDNKQHAATAKRLTDLRKQGTVLRSRDLTSGLVFIVSIILLLYMTSDFKKRLIENFVMSFTHFNELINNTDAFLAFTKQIIIKNVMMIIPIFILSVIVTLISPFLFGGWNFTLDAIQFKLTKLNPISNLSKTLSIKNTAMEFIRSMLKSFFIFGVMIAFVYVKKSDILKLTNYTFNSAVNSSFSILEEYIVFISIALVFLIIFDMAYHFYQFQKQSKMSSQEVKEEQRSTEGSMETKRKIKSAQIALLKQRLGKAVPKASVVITNPTHYAVALRYESEKDKAPIVVAKGKGLIAQQIRTLAIANGVPLYEAPVLARAIYHTANLNAEIHPALYMAVAIVLSYVHQLKHYQMGRGQAPTYVNEFDIPKEFIYDE